ncbi:hypothetical protein KR009_006326, partial [Drosophila setifemur]
FRPLCCGGKSKKESKTKSNFANSVHRVKGWKSEPNFKITVVGAGKVGSACCAFLLIRNLVKDLVIYDKNYEWAQAEARDFIHGGCWMGDPRVSACGDGSNTKNSDLIIFTAGARPGKKTRLEIMHDTVKILQEAVPNLVKLSPKAMFLIASNPVDVMTHAVQKIGNVPKHRCFTSGCHLDSARFRYFIAQRLRLPISAVQGYVIGEHGNSMVPVWSSAQVCGFPMSTVVESLGCGDDPENWSEIDGMVKTAGRSISSVRGFTNWAVALACTDIVEAMRGPNGKVICMGTDVQGVHSIDESIVLSLPCHITSSGISTIYELPLSNDEHEKLMKSADVLLEAQCSLKL